MTEREWRLRATLDRLRDERDAARQQRDSLRQRQNDRRRLRAGMRLLRCIYCGERTYCQARPAVCPSHRSLLALDPVYSVEVGAA